MWNLEDLLRATRRTSFEAGRLLRAGRLSSRDRSTLGVSAWRSANGAGSSETPPGLTAFESAQIGAPRSTHRKQCGSSSHPQERRIHSGFETRAWTLPRIHDVIARHFGVSYHPAYLSFKMRELTVSTDP